MIYMLMSALFMSSMCSIDVQYVRRDKVNNHIGLFRLVTLSLNKEIRTRLHWW